jgi:hypothetical protein
MDVAERSIDDGNARSFAPESINSRITRQAHGESIHVTRALAGIRAIAAWRTRLWLAGR